MGEDTRTDHESRRKIPRRRVLQTGLVAATGTLAGCSGSGGGGTDTTADGADTETSADGTDAAASGDGDPTTRAETATAETDAASGVVEIPSYEFAEGESYTYDALVQTSDGTLESTETWEVTSVDGDQLTVEVSTTIDGETTSQTVTGTHETIYDSVDQAVTINYFSIARSALRVAEMGELTAGNSFTIQASQFPNEGDISWSTAAIDVIGETSVNGVTCTEFTMEPDDEDQVQTICVADDFPFVVSLHQEQGGTTVIDLTLTDATRP